ncbi:hypothetical protein C8R44DRAFT_604187, partial [Mycena epipterygia]
GLNRASFIRGSSTTNTRVERLWVEVGSQFAREEMEYYLVRIALKYLQDMCFVGQIQDGVYVNDYDNVHPSILAQHHGVHGRETHQLPRQTGAGQLKDEDVPLPLVHNADNSDEDSDSDDDLEAQIEAAHALDFHHEPVPVPKYAEPFQDDAMMQLFHNTLSVANEDSVVPEGYGLLPQEWETEFILHSRF